MLIVVCGPYSGKTQWEVEENVRRAQEAAQRLLAAGHEVICPHTMTRGWEGAHGLEYEDFMRNNLEAIRRADAILYLGPSPGADRERALAEELGKDVYIPGIPGTEALVRLRYDSGGTGGKKGAEQDKGEINSHGGVE